MEREHQNITDRLMTYGLIFAAALFSRMLQLGRMPLLEKEAYWAFQAWQLARGEVISMGSRVGYLSVTAGLFSLFSGSDFLARFWPALIGSLIVGIPYLLRKRIDPMSALVLAAGLALDPALVAVSRTAGSAVPALVFLALAVVSFHNFRFIWSGSFFVLGMLSGPDFWLGLIVYGLGTLICSLTGIIDGAEYLQERWQDFKDRSSDLLSRLALPLLLIGLLASQFLTNLQGLSAWAGAFPEFVSSWFQPSGIPPLSLLISLLLSNPFGLVFGFLGFYRAWQSDSRFGKMLSVWFGVILALLLIYPGRQPGDLVWLAVPLWMAAAKEAVRIFRSGQDFWVTYSLAGLVGVLLTLNWLTFIGLVFQAGNDRAALLYLGLLAASLLLVILSMTIISSEWGGKTAWKGLAFGVGVMLILYQISSLTLDGYRFEKDPRSLYTGDRGTGQMSLLRESIYDAGLTAAGRGYSIEGLVMRGTDLLRWTLRDFPGIIYDSEIDPQNPPPLAITISAEGSARIDKEIYRGQDFVLTTRPGWEGLLPSDWISWIGFRQGPLEREHLILWIRNDINSGY